MTEEQKDLLIDNLKYVLDLNSGLSLELDASDLIGKQEYDAEDLLNATYIFMHVLWNISTAYHIRKGLNLEQNIKIAEELWKNLRQHIELATWIYVPSALERILKAKKK